MVTKVNDAIRREIAARFNNDIHRIAADARLRQAASGLPVWHGPDEPESFVHSTATGDDNVINAEFEKK